MGKKSKRRHHKSNQTPRLFVLGGFLILVAAFLVFKEKPQVALTSEPNLLAEEQLELALQAHQPVLAFFHSTTCQNCVIMMETVAQIYPQYQDNVTLVDVNVYEDQNLPLLRQVRLQYIPTLIFYDQDGQADTHIGVMDAPQLSSILTKIAGVP
jgi:thioredoxin-like negative regulator of GroEL